MNEKIEEFNIQEYMTKGVERIVSDALKATAKNPHETAFMLKFAAASRAASQKTKKAPAAACFMKSASLLKL